MARYSDSSYSDHRAEDERPHLPHRLFVYLLMLVIAAAFAGFIWSWYSGGREAPLIQAELEAYKVAPPTGGVELAEGEARADEAVTPRAEPEAPLDAAAQIAARPQPVQAPRFVSNGPFLAQLAALQSEAAVAPAWARFSARAPDLFADARLDVERADLGARGIYYRVRAGHFPDRVNAVRFCDAIRQLGQDCIVVAR